MEFNTDLPALPKGWVWTRVGKIYDIVGGGTPSTKVNEYWIGDIPWITSADIIGLKDIRPRKYINKEAIEDSATNLVPKSSLIIVTRVGLGKVALTKYSLCFSQDCQALIGKNFQPHPDYSLYYLSQVVQIFKYQHRGTTISGVTKKQLSELLFALPPLPEQHRIVNKIEELFTKLDAGVDALKKIKIQLKRYRQAVLKNAFEGNLTQQWREAHKEELEPASVLLEKIKEQRKKESKGKFIELPPIATSELPELPEGWVWTRVGVISEINPKFYKENFYDDAEITFLPMRCVEELTGRINLSITKKLSEVIKGYTYFADGDILYAKITPCMENGKIAIAYNLKNGVGFGSTEFHVIRLYKLLPRKFLFFFLIQRSLRKDAQRQMTGSAGQLRVPVNYLSHVSVPLPPLPEQHQIVSEIERRLSVADQLEKVVEQSLKQAERLRQSILKRAFEGKLVPQDPTDEPAEKLLERIKEEKERRGLVKEKSRKRK